MGFISCSAKDPNNFIDCPNIFTVIMNQNMINWNAFKVSYIDANQHSIQKSLWDHSLEHIPDAVCEFKEHSKINETWFDANNFFLDTRISGEEVPRLPTDAEYHMQCTMTVHSKHNHDRMDSAQ